ncbi:MAG: ribonuclease D [Acidimicrobiales bacterium]
MHEPITATADLEEFIERALASDRYAIDTEFHREKTYYPKVALVQMATADELVLIDPLEVDLGPLSELLDSDRLCVMHAASQDLEVMLRSCGVLPRRLFDTQIAAGFLGLASASLATLLSRYEAVQLKKGDRLTDWLRRPLSSDQLSYAAADVEHLLPAADKLFSQLSARGRLEWVEDECQKMLAAATYKRTPAESVRRIKEARNLKGRALGIALELVAWRESRAAEIDVPVRSVLSDIALVGVAQRAPRTPEELKGIRGVDGRHTGPQVGPAILEVVSRSRDLEAPAPIKPRGSDLDKGLRPVVSLVTSWVSQVARDADLDPSMLATRTDVENFLTDGNSSRLDDGWRNELIGGPIRMLVRGEAAIAFDGSGGLVLERRSGELL